MANKSQNRATDGIRLGMIALFKSIRLQNDIVRIYSEQEEFRRCIDCPKINILKINPIFPSVRYCFAMMSEKDIL